MSGSLRTSSAHSRKHGLDDTELGYLDGVTAGTATASKAVVLGASKEIATITSATITTLTAPNIAGATTFADGTTDIDIASHDGTNGLKLGGVLQTALAAEVNASTDVSLNAGVFKSAKIAFGAAELGGSETNTSFTAPAGGMLILPQTAIFVSDAESGTMDVGTQGTSDDPDGIFDAIDLTNTGWVFPTDVHTTGLNIDYLASTTRGALLYDIEIGSDSATDGGYANYVGSFITAADPISITSSGDLNSCSGFILLYYIELPTIA